MLDYLDIILFIIIIYILYKLHKQNKKLLSSLSLLTSEFSSQKTQLSTLQTQLSALQLNYQIIYELYRDYIIAIFKNTNNINDLKTNLEKMSTDHKRSYTGRIILLHDGLRKIHLLLTHLARQMFTEKTLEIVREKLLLGCQIDRVHPINHLSENIDMPRDLKGEVGERIVERFLIENFPHSQITNQSNSIANGDIEMKIGNRLILVEVKNWHHVVDTDNVNKFLKYARRAKYSAGILVNIDCGKIEYEGRMIESGIEIRYNKPLVFLSGLSYDLRELKKYIEILIEMKFPKFEKSRK